MQTKDFLGFELKAGDEHGTFEGLLAVYDRVDEGGDSISPGAFRKTLSEGASIVPLLWQHDPAEPIGTLQLTDSPTALKAHGKLVLSVPRAAQAYELLLAGALRGLSIGYKTIKDSVEQNGAVRRLKELRLFEGSLVSVPMQSAAVVTSVKRVSVEDDETLAAFRNAARDVREFHKRMIDG